MRCLLWVFLEDRDGVIIEKCLYQDFKVNVTPIEVPFLTTSLVGSMTQEGRTTVYLVRYVPGFGVLCFVVVISSVVSCLPISFKVASLALGQSYDCPSAREVTLKDMGKIDQKQKKAQAVRIPYIIGDAVSVAS